MLTSAAMFLGAACFGVVIFSISRGCSMTLDVLLAAFIFGSALLAVLGFIAIGLALFVWPNWLSVTARERLTIATCSLSIAANVCLLVRGIVLFVGGLA